VLKIEFKENIMSIEFTWKEEYSVGNPDIDKQHKQMFALGNRLSEVSDFRDIKPIIMELYKYVREHFAREEVMMKSSGFPLLETHGLKHDALITQLNEISYQPFDTDEAVYRLKKLIYEWLSYHIMHEDQKYCQFRREQNERASNKPDADNSN
jgi:hemerythrin